MSYKSLLVVLDFGPDSGRRINLAAALAERFAAHLVGLCQLPPLEWPPENLAVGPGLLEPLYRELREAAEDETERLRQAFEEATRRRGVSAEWRSVVGGAIA